MTLSVPVKDIGAARVLYAIATGFLLGALVYIVLPVGLFFPALFLLCAAILLLLCGMKFLLPRYVLVVLALVCAAFGMVRVEVTMRAEEPLAPYLGGHVEMRGFVVADPSLRERTLQVLVAVESIDGATAAGRTLLFLERGESLGYGDRIAVSGQLERPEVFETETGKVFDYPGYLRARGIGGTMFRPEVIQEEGIAGYAALRILYAIKHAYMRSIESVFPEPQAGLLEGMLLGVQDALPEKTVEAFRRSSLIHIVVLSGYNLTIVALAFMWLLSLIPKVPRSVRLVLGGISIVLFAAMVGGGATVVRASAMALIALLAQALRRPQAALRALLIAASCMVLHNPLILLHDPAFILSFLATFGLITLSAGVEKKISFVTDVAGLRQIAAATLSVQVFILPALIFYTGMFSIVSLPANMLVLPFVSFTMLLGALAGGLGLLSSVLAFPIMLPATVLLSGIIMIASLGATIPGGVIELSYLQTPYLFLIYILALPLSLQWMRLYTVQNERGREGKTKLSILQPAATHIEAQ